jgi:hypothetical protein
MFDDLRRFSHFGRLMGEVAEADYASLQNCKLNPQHHATTGCRTAGRGIAVRWCRGEMVDWAAGECPLLPAGREFARARQAVKPKRRGAVL